MNGLQWPSAGLRTASNGSPLEAPTQPGDGVIPDGVAHEILAGISDDLVDGADPAEVTPVIEGAVREWAQRRAQRGGALPGQDQRDRIAQAVYDLRYGFGPLEPYLRDPQVENIDINGCDEVWISYATGERERVAAVAASDAELTAMIRKLAARGGQTAREFSAAAPLVNVAIGRRVRMTATIDVTPRPCVSLRRHGHTDVTLDDLVELGTLDHTLRAFLAAAVRSRRNIIVSGGVNAGKTTLLRALASEIPPDQRIATLESEYELYLHETGRHPDVIAFEAREANSEGAGGISLRDLIPHALRHNPARILVGEARTSEVLPMLEAMNTGLEGSMCTLHADSPEEAFDRILILGLRGGLALAERAIHILTGMAVDLIVHIRRRHDGQRTLRYVCEVLEVLPPADSERPSVNRVFVPEGSGGPAVPRPTASPGLLRALETAGFDTRLLDQPTVMTGGWS